MINNIANSRLPKKIKIRKISKLLRKKGYTFIDAILMSKAFIGIIMLDEIKQKIESRPENSNLTFPYFITAFDNSSFHEYINTNVYTKKQLNNDSILITGENELKNFQNAQNIRANEIFERSRKFW